MLPHWPTLTVFQHGTDYHRLFVVHEDREKVLLGYEKQMRGDDDGMYLSLLHWSSTYTAIPFGSNSSHFCFKTDSEMSEQEVYGLEGVDSDEEEDQNDYQSDDDDEKDDEEEKESESWGQSKKSYYDADEGSDLEEMREEEQEAIRLQKKRIEAMDEEDFVDAGWGGVSLEKVSSLYSSICGLFHLTN